jgi:hypothetical protein
MEWLSYFVGLGSTPVVVGISVWLGKVWANRILEKDRAKYQTQVETLLADIRVRNDKELLVHRLQFEKEFAIYQELWSRARRLVTACRGFSDLQQGPLKPEDELVAEFLGAHDDFLETVLAGAPFYATTVYEAAEVLRKAVVSLHWTHQRIRRLEGAKDPEKVLERVMQLDDEKASILETIPASLPGLRDAIRERIWSTHATGWDRTTRSEDKVSVGEPSR